MSITLQSEDQVYFCHVSIKVFHRLWFDNPKKGKAAVSAQGGFAVFRCTQMRRNQRRPRATEARWVAANVAKSPELLSASS
jgi:hypothetical protein